MALKKYNERLIELYVGSSEQKKKIQDDAKANGSTTSKYILSIINEAGQEKKPAAINPTEVQDLKEENSHLAEELRDSERRVASLEAELRRMRNKEHIEPHGRAAYDPALLQALVDGPIHDHQLLDALGIDLQDYEAIRAVSAQLQSLEVTGLIKKVSRGWVWQK